MRARQLILLSLILLTLAILVTSRAAAQGDQCWSYSEEQQFNCVGAGGCRGSYYETYCYVGCLHGWCTNRGGSGECCGRIYYTASGSSDGTCLGFDCGLARVHTSSFRDPKGRDSAEVQHVATTERLGATADPAVGGLRVPRLMFVPDRCAHTYGMIVQEGHAPSGAGGI